MKSRETIVNRSLTKNSWPAYDLTSLLLIAQAILSPKFTALFRHEYLRKKRLITLPDDKTLIAQTEVGDFAIEVRGFGEKSILGIRSRLMPGMVSNSMRVAGISLRRMVQSRRLLISIRPLI